jgi:hypothetical protein
MNMIKLTFKGKRHHGGGPAILGESGAKSEQFVSGFPQKKCWRYTGYFCDSLALEIYEK